MTIHEHAKKLIFLLAVLILTAGCGGSDSKPDSAGGETIDALVTTAWLGEHLDDPDLVVLDCTVRIVMDENGMRGMSGRADYEAGHIPGAGFADLTGDLCDADSPLAYALPAPARFCEVMGALGVGDDSRVVLYDDFNSVWAARVWWMLRWVGFDRAAVLDGGLAAWTAEERPLSTEPADRETNQLTPEPRPELIAHRDEVLAAIGDDAVTLIDTMPEAHFKGRMAMYARPGHIPGAVNVPTTALFDEAGRYLPLDELAVLCTGDREARVITYCGGGIAASAHAFVLVRLGFTDVAVYAASLQEWAADPDLPLVVEAP
jgi:thiosulfate/3-mercaptopyruvate sulfurtransferase